MTDKEILEKAIHKAIEGGWDVFGTENHQIDVEDITLEMLDDDEHYHSTAPHTGLTVYIRRNGYYSPQELIFNHDFAEALWGEEVIGNCYNCTEGAHYPGGHGYGIDKLANWQWHIQEMVIAEDPIKYLGDNI